jgi:hypothetical protein
MKGPDYKPDVKLAGEDGNAFSILGRVAVALRRAGVDDEYIENYQDRATGGDYNNLLAVSMGEINHV